VLLKKYLDCIFFVTVYYWCHWKR